MAGARGGSASPTGRTRMPSPPRASGLPVCRRSSSPARPSAPRRARRGLRGSGVPAPGGRLRRVVPRRLRTGLAREAEGAAADVGGPDLRRDAPGHQGRAGRGAVREATQRADRGRRRGRAAVLSRPQRPLGRADAGSARPRSRANGAGLLPGRVHTQPAPCVHEGRLRGPDARPHLEPRVRRELTGGQALRSARGRDRARAAVHAGDRDRPHDGADTARSRRLDQPRRTPAPLRGSAHAPGLLDRPVVRLLGAHALDRESHPRPGGRARQVLLRCLETRSV